MRTGPTLDEACRDAVPGAVSVLARATALAADEASMLASLVGDLEVGTSPRPVMAVRVVLPGAVLSGVGR